MEVNGEATKSGQTKRKGFESRTFQRFALDGGQTCGPPLSPSELIKLEKCGVHRGRTRMELAPPQLPLSLHAFWINFKLEFTVELSTSLTLLLRLRAQRFSCSFRFFLPIETF